jgi:hypothetical protein
MITGAHVIVYSSDAEAVTEFLRDVLELPSMDAGGGWMLYPLPAELAVHPVDEGSKHELYLVCDDLDATMADLRRKDVRFQGDVVEARWGRRITIELPDGSPLSIYEPSHPTAIRAD